jgi:SAM-dependent methyltransferase
MRNWLIDLLACPACGASLTIDASLQKDGRVVQGTLSCGCGKRYPVVDAVPRLLLGGDLAPEAFRCLQERTRRSFGYQWTTFADMFEAFREDFLTYVGVPPEFFRGKIGLDAGCGFGRHLFYAATMDAKMVGMDFSAAAEQAFRHVDHLPNADVIQGDIYHPPFQRRTFDFVFSIGVLHHLPDPEAGFQALLPLIKPGGAVLIWVYSKSRRRTNAILEAVRRVTSRLPFGAIKALSLLGAGIDWACFIGPYKIATRSQNLRPLVDRLVLSRVKLYARYPFQVSYADWFDRLSAPVRFYYDEADLFRWAERAGLQRVRVSPTGRYGFRLYGEV